MPTYSFRPICAQDIADAIGVAASSVSLESSPSGMLNVQTPTLTTAEYDALVTLLASFGYVEEAAS